MNKETTYEVPPNYPTFSARLGISVNTANKNNLAVQSQISSTPAATTPIIIQLPPQLYQNQEYLTSSSHTQLLSSPGNLPSIGEFFRNLDQKYNCSNVYAKFEDSFLEEEITVNAIKDLSDDQLTKLGVVKIGWQKNIKQATQKF